MNIIAKAIVAYDHPNGLGMYRNGALESIALQLKDGVNVIIDHGTYTPYQVAGRSFDAAVLERCGVKAVSVTFRLLDKDGIANLIKLTNVAATILVSQSGDSGFRVGHIVLLTVGAEDRKSPKKSPMETMMDQIGDSFSHGDLIGLVRMVNG